MPRLRPHALEPAAPAHTRCAAGTRGLKSPPAAHRAVRPPPFVTVRYVRDFPWPVDACYAWLTDYRDSDPSLTEVFLKKRPVLAREKDLVLVHDITYHDFAFDPALAGEFAPERTLYMYSFSKNCGLAGMRIGALVGQKPLMDRVVPYLVGKLGTNVLAQRAALAALETKKDWIGRVVEQARANQRRIVETVRKIDGLSVPVYPSSSNTLVIDVSALKIDPNEVERRLLFDHKVFVRGGPYLSKRSGPRFVRVSFTVPEVGVERFCEAFPRVVGELAERRR